MPDDHEALTDPALPAGALATLDSGLRSGARRWRPRARSRSPGGWAA